MNLEMFLLKNVIYAKLMGVGHFPDNDFPDNDFPDSDFPDKDFPDSDFPDG
jgi:hypothetical protein